MERRSLETIFEATDSNWTNVYLNKLHKIEESDKPEIDEMQENVIDLIKEILKTIKEKEQELE